MPWQTYCCHECDSTQLQFADILHKKRRNTQGGHLKVGHKKQSSMLELESQQLNGVVNVNDVKPD